MASTSEEMAGGFGRPSFHSAPDNRERERTKVFRVSGGALKTAGTVLLFAVMAALCGAGRSWANAVEDRFLAAGLVDVSGVDATIRVDLVNSDAKKNFFRTDFYNGLNRAYLQRSVALKLADAQRRLRAENPGLSLLILDAARPRSVSKRMYDKMRGTKFERFVADPKKGSMHNYGVAVDITIVDDSGKMLDMGFSPFCQSTPRLYWAYLKKKIGITPTRRQLGNRRLLAQTMTAAGFIPLSFEWWHFDGLPKAEARRRFGIVE